MRGFAIAIAVVLSLSLSTEGCRRYQRVVAKQNVCLVGQPVECQCANGASGTQSCRPDGTGFFACDCAASIAMSAPASVTAGDALTNVVVTLRDATMAPLSESTERTVSLSIVNAASPTLLAGAKTAKVANGAASFAGAHIDLAGTYELEASYAGELATSIARATITVNGGAPVKLVIATEPPGVFEQGTAIVPAPVVVGKDAFDNDATSTAVVTATVSGPAGFAVGPFPSASMASGVATFTKLSVLSPVEGVAQFSFSVPSVSAIPAVLSRSVSFVRPDVEWPRFPIGFLVPTLIVGGFLDETTGLHWSSTEVQGTFAGAAAACGAIPQATIDGRMYSWRVPALVEMATLLSHQKLSPPFSALPTTPPLRSEKYWTRSAVPATADGYVVDLATGRTAVEPGSNSHYIVCVLETTPPRTVGATDAGGPALQYANVGDGTIAVRDQKTGLSWFRSNVACSGCVYTAAVSACDQRSDLGFDDWRLPTAQELATIVNVRVAGAAAHVATPTFVGALATEYWSSTADPLTAANALTVDFATGAMQTRDKTVAGTTAVRCVR
ncbi:MAG: DUF1566 domain-containing protein [Deltaproteobacteria bacterium]|nr:DUF1566 domain-containing protein [Deltaproteobacteria bacterium]